MAPTRRPRPPSPAGHRGPSARQRSTIAGPRPIRVRGPVVGASGSETGSTVLTAWRKAPGEAVGAHDLGARGSRRPRPGISLYLVATFGVAIALLSLLGWVAAQRAYHEDEAQVLSQLQAPAAMQAQAVGAAV